MREEILSIYNNYKKQTLLFSVPGLLTNMIFAMINGISTYYVKSYFLMTMSAYYFLLSIMKINIHYQEGRINEEKQSDRKEYLEIALFKRNSLLFLLLGIILAGITIIAWNEGINKKYPGLLIYIVAIYTFDKLIISIYNIIKVRKKNSLMLTMMRLIGHIDALVSLFILQTTLISRFGDPYFGKIMNLLFGVTICIICFSLGIRGYYQSNKRLKDYESIY